MNDDDDMQPSQQTENLHDDRADSTETSVLLGVDDDDATSNSGHTGIGGAIHDLWRLGPRHILMLINPSPSTWIIVMILSVLTFFYPDAGFRDHGRPPGGTAPGASTPATPFTSVPLSTSPSTTEPSTAMSPTGDTVATTSPSSDMDSSFLSPLWNGPDLRTSDTQPSGSDKTLDNKDEPNRSSTVISTQSGRSSSVLPQTPIPLPFAVPWQGEHPDTPDRTATVSTPATK